KPHLRVRKARELLDRKAGEFVLLALDDEGIWRVALEDPVVEFGDQAAGWTIPELQGPSDEPAAYDLLEQTELGQYFEGGGMGRRRPRRRIDPLGGLEDKHLDAPLRQRQSRHQPDRTATGDENPMLRW